MLGALLTRDINAFSWEEGFLDEEKKRTFLPNPKIWERFAAESKVWWRIITELEKYSLENCAKNRA